MIYEGEQKIDKDSFLASPTETVYQGRENLRNQLEDVARYEMHDGRVTMQYLFANQTRRDSKMIFRKAGYVGSAYREQYDGKVKDVYPVVEIVLYWCFLASGNVFSKKVWLSDSNQRIWKRQRKDRKTTENRGKGTSFAGRYSRAGGGISAGGIVPDNISSIVHIYGLRLQVRGEWHPAYDAFCRRQEPCAVTMENLQELTVVQPTGDKVYKEGNVTMYLRPAAECCRETDTLFAG